jgi:hypothetical protein
MPMTEHHREVAEGPAMVHTANPARPCRHHLFGTLYKLPPAHQSDAAWRIPVHVWEAIKAAPDMRTDWSETRGRNGNGIIRTLLAQPVHLVQGGLDHAQLVIDVDCR